MFKFPDYFRLIEVIIFRPLFKEITGVTRRKLTTEEEANRHLIRVLTAALENPSLSHLLFLIVNI